MLFRHLTIVNAFCYALVTCGPSQLVVHERRSDIPLQKWTKGPRLHPDDVLPVRIGLTQTNLDKGHDLLMEISTPGSPLYGKHMSSDEIVNLFAPKNESIESVTTWLTSAGVDHSRLALSSNKQWIKFDASVAEIERILDAEYHVYQHQSTFEEDIATEHYSVPQHAREHVDYITPGIRLRSLRSSRRREEEAEPSSLDMSEQLSERSSRFANCTTAGMTPECIAAIYNISEATSAVTGNDMGFYEGFGDIYYQKDFDRYTKRYYPRIPQGFSPEVLSVDGSPTKYNYTYAGDAETALDVQVALPIIYPQGFRIWQTMGTPNTINVQYKGWFNTWLDALDGSYCNYTAFGITGDTTSSKIDPNYPSKAWPHPEQCGVYEPTNVISVSYGGAEAALPAAYVKRQCNEYMKLGMQGKSIFFCSQDDGVQGGIGLHGCLGPKGKVFEPIFPATCPYVTSVGATTFPKGSNVLDPSLEMAARFSGGGFSNVWPAPTYQKAAVDHYLTTYPPHHPSYSTENDKNIGADGGVFNRNGRGFPDISALGNYFIGFSNNEDQFSAGTSMSAPLVAAMFNRINEERLLRSKSTVGFVNPALYTNSDLMRDIVKGHNFGCDYKGVGFNVTKGWDPVTGLGSPSFPDLLKYFTSLD